MFLGANSIDEGHALQGAQIEVDVTSSGAVSHV